MVQLFNDLLQDVSNHHLLTIPFELPTLPQTELPFFLGGFESFLEDVSFRTVFEVRAGFEVIVKGCQRFLPQIYWLKASLRRAGLSQTGLSRAGLRRTGLRLRGHGKGRSWQFGDKILGKPDFKIGGGREVIVACSMRPVLWKECQRLQPFVPPKADYRQTVPPLNRPLEPAIRAMHDWLICAYAPVSRSLSPPSTYPRSLTRPENRPPIRLRGTLQWQAQINFP